MEYDVVIIGGGLSGLTCAKELHKKGTSFILLEAEDQPGGRIRTDEFEGFRLDRGFQVLQTGYPEALKLLDYDDLDLHAFPSGVAVRCHGKFHIIADPRSHPRHILSTAIAPIGTLKDRFAMAKLSWSVCRGHYSEIFGQREEKTLDFLHDWGFSDAFIRHFLTPFFAGACLDRTLSASSRVFKYIFRVFAEGNASIPAMGMAQIPGQIASAIPPEKILLNCRVTAVNENTVTLADGSTFTGRRIIWATSQKVLEEMEILPESPPSLSESCVYFASENRFPFAEPFLVLNGESEGPINNIAAPSMVAPHYAPKGKTLIAAVVLGHEYLAAPDLEERVRGQCIEWFGDMAAHWRHLRTYHIQHALPNQEPPSANPYILPEPINEHMRVCGEYQSLPGIQWALLSGRKTAEVVLHELSL